MSLPAAITAIPVAELDKYVETLRKDAEKLRNEYRGNDFLQRKAGHLEKVIEILLALRREKQMTTVGGQRLE